MSRSVVLLLLTALVLSSLFMVGCAFAESIPKPSVPEFTLKYVDYSYDVPAKTTSTTDPYTNETTTTSVPGYRVENKTIEVTISNNIGASYYNFRYKGNYGEEWSYYPFDPDSFRGYNLYSAYRAPTYVAASDSDYSVILICLTYLPESIPEDGLVDIQVQALFGGYRQGDPESMFAPGGPTYNFYFEGTTSDWSDAQTIRIGESQPSTPFPTNYTGVGLSETEIIIGASIIVAIVIVGLGLLLHLIKRK